jgi:glycine dehydrogenase
MHDAEPPLDVLERRDAFVGRHIGPTADDRRAMLRRVGVVSMEAFLDQVVPSTIRSDQPLALEAARTETEVLAELRHLSAGNQVYRSLIGMGYSDCHMPAVIQRNLFENPAWYTAYTPYQAEISQGRLEALLNFQTMVMDLTGMELANASLLDEATAAAEAMVMCRRLSRSKSEGFFVASGCHPQTLAVVRTRAEPLGISVRVGDSATDLAEADVFGALLQYPDTWGEAVDHETVIEQLHQRKALAVVATDLLALMLLRPPGDMGADIVVGSAQRFGVPMGYGGPHAAFMATRDAYKRATPGRIIGVSVDSRGDPAYRMALQTREQHIRREKATSNICTAQALLAIVAGMYAVYHGPEGLETIARRVHRLTRILALGLERLGAIPDTACYFDTLTVRTGGRAEAVHRATRSRRVNLREIDADRVGVSLDETVSREDVSVVLAAFAEAMGGQPATVEALDAEVAAVIPRELHRKGEVLTHPIFRRHHSETEMLRYMRRLADKDLALDRSMIPLGSCTMKLNATSEMIPITWPEFCGLHPFAPVDQTQGYRRLFEMLESMLCACTGYDAVSLQPNSGAQGEYAGLLAIRAYHRSRGEGHRNVCLIPSSAHGTNPASAQMAGMRVVVVRCDDDGNVDLADLGTKAAQHADALAAIMVTYPSTHGVFETAIGEVCRVVHEHGGQVYLDGANLNAQVGLAAPGHYGADVSHLNLHKTFCIPHGGGGPGVGPIGVRAHLAPYLPKGAVLDIPADGDVGPVSAAPWGSAGILPITWMYIRMMGGEGLLEATRMALLNANYIARRLEAHYPVLYTGANGMVAHECIIDLRPIKDSSGVTVDDVAKRLVDYGFHAPTMSFPVAGTLMIEPTESEPKVELDRFCDAMIEIRNEIRQVEEGVWPVEDNPLCNAPHTVADLADGDWAHPYSRERAAFPLPGLRQDKYWTPVGRIDNVQGDRHLICSCPPIESYEGAA